MLGPVEIGSVVWVSVHPGSSSVEEWSRRGTFELWYQGQGPSDVGGLRCRRPIIVVPSFSSQSSSVSVSFLFFLTPFSRGSIAISVVPSVASLSADNISLFEVA